MSLIQIPKMSSLCLPPPTSPFTPIDSVISLWAAAVAAVADRGGRPCNAVGKTCRKMRARETATSRPPLSPSRNRFTLQEEREERKSVFDNYISAPQHIMALA